MSIYDRERRIREEERLRHEARRDLERRDAAREQDFQDSYERDLAYVQEYGRMGAAKITFAKWACTGIVFAIFRMFDAEGDLLEVLKSAGGVLFLFVVIGLWRAAKYGTFDQ